MLRCVGGSWTYMFGTVVVGGSSVTLSQAQRLIGSSQGRESGPPQ